LESWDIRSLDVPPRHPQVIRSDREARVIVINLPAGEQLQEHQTHERAYLLVVDGEIEVDGAGGAPSETGGSGYLAHFEPQERRGVRATQDSRVVLILGPWPGVGHPSERPDG
jgi:quercetin dioxygenase-like cupin family protein